MPDPIQAEPTVPAGSGDADFDAALAEVSVPVIPADAPPVDAEHILREVHTSEEPKTSAWYWHDEIDKHFAGVK